MKLPTEVPVMTLPGATLFPQALLPLYVFEPRYRRMLSDMLDKERMFSVAMQKPGRQREIPCHVAGLGLIRVSVNHLDGTSHLVLLGLSRVCLGETVQYKPYRVHAINPIKPPQERNAAIDALHKKIIELVRQRFALGDLPFPLPMLQTGQKGNVPDHTPPQSVSNEEMVQYLESLPDAESVSDMVACSFLSSSLDRQTILETLDLEQRLKHLVHFLMAEIQLLKINKSL